MDKPSSSPLCSSHLHHIALGARQVETVAAFYREVFGLQEVARHHLTDSSVRSIWLELGCAVLMIEKTEQTRGYCQGVDAGPFLLAFRISSEETPMWEARLLQHGGQVESRSDFSSYARDPEGNRVAVSHYELPSGCK